MTEQPAAYATKGLLEERYRLGEKIGEGGMAFVYRAEDTVTGQDVAIKILRDTLSDDPVSIARIHYEAAVGARLTHPNICRVLHLGKVGGTLYLVMPLLQGQSLWHRMAGGEALELDDTLRVVQDVAAGLHQVHELGVVHRDLKPDNIIMIREADGRERAVLLDFGLATGHDPAITRPRITKTGAVVGTQEFMSPEQMSGKTLDRRSDIYSLAFLAYEMLTGELPLRGHTLREIALARLTGQMIPLRSRRPDLPEGVESVVTRALSLEPQERHATTLEFAVALARAASATP